MTSRTRTWLGLLVVILVIAFLAIMFYGRNKPDCRFEDNVRCFQPAFSNASTDYAGT